MLIRSRSIRFAALALVATTPLVASYAAPAFADGGDAEVSITLPMEPGVVEVHSTKGLSRTTVVLCDGSLVVIPSWAGDPTDGEVEVSGPVRAVFIHSGNNTTNAAETLLESLAPGAVNGNSTGAVAYDKACTTENPGGDDTLLPTDISDPAPPKNNPSPQTSNPAPSTVVLGVTIEKASNPAPAPAPATSPVVDNSTLSPGGELPRTGAGHVQLLMTLALSLIAAGAALRVAFGRRIRFASAPG